MKCFLIVLTIFFYGIKVQAQVRSAEDSVKMVINNMFAAMKNADTIALKKCFAETMLLQTISRNKMGELVVLTDEPQKFISSIAGLQPGDADERISFESIKIDGFLASVWTPYEFYYKEKFSHCGANSFQMVRFNGQWKIQYIIDTRRKSNCQ